MAFYLVVILISIGVGFALSWLPLRLGVPGAIVLPFATVLVLNLLWDWFVPVSSVGASMSGLGYIIVAVPGAIVTLLSIWVLRKLVVAKAKA